MGRVLWKRGTPLPEGSVQVEQNNLLLFLTEFPPGDESSSSKGVSGVCLLCLVNGIPYMALVFLTGDRFLDRKLILSQFFR